MCSEPLTLAATARNNGRKWFADLTWSPADGGRVDVYLNGSVVKATRDDGVYSYSLGRNASGAYDLQVCEQDSGDCSNVFTLNVTPFAEASLTGEELPVTGLIGAYPNPFASTATIAYGAGERMAVELSVYNTLGQRVAVLADEVVEAGRYQATLDGADLPSGVYIYRLRIGGEVQTGQLMLVK